MDLCLYFDFTNDKKKRKDLMLKLDISPYADLVKDEPLFKLEYYCWLSANKIVHRKHQQ